MTLRHEHVDTRALLRGDLGDANLTSPAVRLAERERVLAYWPRDVVRAIVDGSVVPPPWRLLLDPTAWGDVDPREVHEYVCRSVEYGRWPALDALRRRFGRVSNHRGGDEVPAQGSLL